MLTYMQFTQSSMTRYPYMAESQVEKNHSPEVPDVATRVVQATGIAMKAKKEPAVAARPDAT